jgi:alkanesulfonate monooxygenase SsuD/methylene tetrahydromethanopterin reductase-like flavin-dependent oxidoreductase (luciferase family)
MERQDPAQSMERVAEQALELVQLADEAGFEIVWAIEHHGHEYYVGPNPLIQLVHWAAQTKRIRLGTAVIVVPYWHPIRLAGEVGMADLLTGGRLEIGVARGAFQYEFDRMLGGLPQEQGGEYLRETMAAVKRLWAGDTEHHGKHWDFPIGTATPKPVQKPHPPLWVAARDPHTFDWAIENDMNVMTTAHRLPFSEVERLMGLFGTALANNPGHRRPRFLTSRMTCVYEDPADWRIPVEAMLASVRIFMGLFNNTSPVIDGFPQPVEISDKDARGDYRPEAIRTNMMFGTPDEVVAKLRQYEALGVDHFIMYAAFGPDHAKTMKSIRLFAERVLPHFRAGSAGR